MPDAAGPLPPLGAPGAPLDEPKSPLGKFTAGSKGRGIRAPHLRLIEGGKNKPRGPIARRTHGEAHQPLPRPIVVQQAPAPTQAAPAPSQAQREAVSEDVQKRHAYARHLNRPERRYFEQQQANVQDAAATASRQFGVLTRQAHAAGGIDEIRELLNRARQHRTRPVRHRTPAAAGGPQMQQTVGQMSEAEYQRKHAEWEARQPHMDLPESERPQHIDWQTWANEEPQSPAAAAHMTAQARENIRQARTNQP